MAWSYDPSTWVTGHVPIVTDFQNIAADLHTAGGNRDGSHYGLPNHSFITLVPGDLPGTSYTVTAGSWSAGTATLTIGAHNLQVNQRVSISGVTPSGYNSPASDSVVITAITGTTIKYAVGSNPGAWSSGGTVIADAASVAAGMLAVDVNDVLRMYNGSAWSEVWNAPTLLNSWTNFGSGFANAAYMIDAFGFVIIRGTITGGTFADGTILFTLPAGFRPPATVAMSVPGTLPTIVQLNVESSGNVKIFDATSNTALHLSLRFATY